MTRALLLSLLLPSGCASTARHEDWSARHPLPATMKSLVELPAGEALQICRRDLLGKNHATVRAYLGAPDLLRAEDEYVYHPVRADGSLWILLVEFEVDSAYAIYVDGLEDLYPPAVKKTNPPPEPPPPSAAPRASARVAPAARMARF